MTDETMTLPRPYLSYSAIDLWYSSKSGYRKRYYEGVKSSSTPQQEYGSEVAELLKSDPDNPVVANIPRLEIRDEPFTVDISGVPMLMVPDSLSLNPIPHFIEYKTSVWVSDKPSWTQKDVDNHMQLKVYSLGIKEKYGAVMDECKLLWLVTGIVTYEDTVKIGGKEHIVPLSLPQLTGQIISFNCVVNEIERFRARQWIVQAAHEIAADYKNHLKNV